MENTSTSIKYFESFQFSIDVDSFWLTLYDVIVAKDYIKIIYAAFLVSIICGV